MPSPHLRRAQIIVRGYCQELGVGYLETSLADSYRKTLASLHAAGAPPSERRRPPDCPHEPDRDA
ncbi:delta fatty acid desaturase [Streptomyces lavendulae]|uniref:delta fatty acid desaturase n=1 Tax=Streptomyces lavendulae TaxID=1914 RepID=UPI003382CFB7